MKLLVTAISLDFETDNDFYRVKPDEQIEIEQDVLGIWEVESEDDLVDKISDTIGWCVNWIDYQPNAPHSLTSFLQEKLMSMTPKEFMEAVYEIAYGEDAYHRGFFPEEVVERLQDFSDGSNPILI